MTPGSHGTAEAPDAPEAPSASGSPGTAPVAAGPPVAGGAGGVVVRAVAPDESALVQACARLVVEVYGGEGLVGSQWYLDHIVADAGRRAREASTLAALGGDGSAGRAGATLPAADLPAADLPAAGPAATGPPGPLLGTAAYAVHGSPYAELAAAGESEMRMLAVSRTARGRGVGRLLTVACIDRAREEGHERFVLSTGPEMRAAHRLYRSLGMRRTPGRDWSPVPDVTLLTFALDLS